MRAVWRCAVSLALFSCGGPTDTDCAATEWWHDFDGDGVGGGAAVEACEQPDGAIEVGGDCDDNDPGRSPDLAEDCGTLLDEDCDGFAPRCLPGGVDNVAARAELRLSTFGARGSVVVGGADVSGDGLADIVLGDAPSILVLPGPLDETTYVGLEAVEITGWNAPGALASAGDADGDGDDELWVGYTSGDDVRGFTRIDGPIVATDLGERDPWLWSSDLAIGGAIASLGDADGDGTSDAIVGGGGLYDPGAAWFVPAGYRGDVASLDALRGRDGFDDRVGSTVAAAGDVDGDGLGDLLVVAPGFDVPAVAVALAPIPSGTSQFADADTLLLGDALTGTLLPTSGDLNGDGRSDVVLALPAASNDAGAVLVFDASVVLAAPDVDLSSSWTARVSGQAAYDALGDGVDAGGDVDIDGLDDLLVGVPNYGGTDRLGAAGLLFGPLSGDLTIDDAYLLVHGSFLRDRIGSHVAHAGDVDGDGAGDLLVSAPWIDEVYLLLGGQPEP